MRLRRAALGLICIAGALTVADLSSSQDAAPVAGTPASLSPAASLAPTCPLEDVASLCSLRTMEADLEAFWARALPGPVATRARLRLVKGNTRTTCGTATPDDGSFYCPDNATIYVQREDLEGFHGDRARSEAATLLAHEFGHHVQARTRDDVSDETAGPTSPSVRYELQADCYAGVWIGQASLGIPRADLIGSVRASGDDEGADPSPAQEFTHGSGARRVAWFLRGYNSHLPTVCDTSGPL